MKLVELLIGDTEYQKIKDLFQNEDDFNPMTETDRILIQAMRAIVSPKNLKEDNVGGEETESLTISKIIEPKDKSLEGNVEFKV
tara:strand:+ start:2349 stop:2600 length:252 start_codon:yes stop_codon:yes gene_type:complete